MRYIKITGFLFLLFLLSSGQLKAQEFATKSHQKSSMRLKLGVKGGVNFDKNQGIHLDKEFNGYFLGGAFAGVQLNRFRFMTEATFSKATMITGDGFKDAFNKYLSEEAQSIKDGTFKMNELSIPFIVGVRFASVFWLEAGPQYTMITSVKDVDGFLKSTQQVLKNGYMSGFVGLSVELPIHVSLGGRYVFGLSDKNNTDVPEQWKSNHIQATVGFNFF